VKEWPIWRLFLLTVSGRTPSAANGRYDRTLVLCAYVASWMLRPAMYVEYPRRRHVGCMSGSKAPESYLFGKQIAGVAQCTEGGLADKLGRDEDICAVGLSSIGRLTSGGRRQERGASPIRCGRYQNSGGG